MITRELQTYGRRGISYVMKCLESDLRRPVDPRSGKGDFPMPPDEGIRQAIVEYMNGRDLRIESGFEQTLETVSVFPLRHVYAGMMNSSPIPDVKFHQLHLPQVENWMEMYFFAGIWGVKADRRSLLRNRVLRSDLIRMTVTLLTNGLLEFEIGYREEQADWEAQNTGEEQPELVHIPPDNEPQPHTFPYKDEIMRVIQEINKVHPLYLPRTRSRRRTWMQGILFND